MLTMIGFKFGDIVLVRFPFTDQRGSKQRPAVVISSGAYNCTRPDAILMAVTSQVRRRAGFGERIIDDWQAAGLIKPSAIKPIIFTVEQRLIAKALGQLKGKDQTALKGTIQEILS